MQIDGKLRGDAEILEALTADADLHIYGQSAWHDEARIIGTAHALRRLRDSINDALLNGSDTMLAFTNDGEGYELTVAIVPDDTFDRLNVPYTDEIARDRPDSGGISPDLFDRMG